eukprot:gb/GECH01007613.1/.p1 GENE.gb/GECH01007613.1/~~gb/GECH01007613.1/.p1  ORF type:complete len:791 (+),score=193.76 gb/GECH01007613.1/:1-2373(+)
MFNASSTDSESTPPGTPRSSEDEGSSKSSVGLSEENEMLPTVWERCTTAAEWSGFDFRMWAAPGTYRIFLKPKYLKDLMLRNKRKKKKYSNKHVFIFAVYLDTQPEHWVQTETIVKPKQTMVEFTVPETEHGVVPEKLSSKKGVEVIILGFNMRGTPTRCDMVLKSTDQESQGPPSVSILHSSDEIDRFKETSKRDSSCYNLREMDIVLDEISNYENDQVEHEVSELIEDLENEESKGIEGAVALNAGKTRVLALDGGGSRGVFHLAVLLKLESMTGMKAFQMFDMISGTSTGGMIAAIVFHLRFPVSFTLEFYLQVAKSLFKDVSSGRRTKRLRSLSAAIYGEGKKMTFNQYPLVALVSMRTELKKSQPETYLFRNYEPNEENRIGSLINGSSQHHGVQAMTSTSAAYPLIQAPTFENFKYVDGSLVANNPTQVALRELRAVSARGSKSEGHSVGFALSLGTGLADDSMPSNLLTRIAPSLSHMLMSVLNALLDTENVDIFCREAFDTSAKQDPTLAEYCDEYLRLNGPKIGPEFPINIHTDKLKQFLDLVNDYLDQREEKKSLENAAAQILSLSVFLKCKTKFQVGEKFIGIITPRAEKAFFPKQFTSKPLKITLQHEEHPKCEIQVTAEQSQPIIVKNRQIVILRGQQHFTVSGSYILTIKRGETNIAGSPSKITVDPETLQISCSCAYGSLLSGGEQEEHRQLIVEGKDAHGNNVALHSDRDEIVVQDETIATGKIVERHPEMIRERAVFYFQLSGKGEHQITIFWKRKPSSTFETMGYVLKYSVT